MQFSTLIVLAAASLTQASPLQYTQDNAAVVASPQSCPDGAYAWFIDPRNTTSCTDSGPTYKPNSGPNNVNASCSPIANPQDPSEQQAWPAADVTLACGGFAIRLFSTSDCSDEGVVTTASPDACVVAPSGAPFVAFNATST